MTQPKSHLARTITVLAASALLIQAAVQGAGIQDPAKLDEINPFREEATGESAQEEMTRLFQEVEQSMNRMGSLLMDASKGETGKLTEVGESGIDELLRNADPSSSSSSGGALADLLNATGTEGQSVLSGIDRILEIAQSQGDGT
ncbi:MAG: hypothetical protein ACI9HE_001662 [Planctomycetota bacterium]|jgi:hypothetical protein